MHELANLTCPWCKAMITTYGAEDREIVTCGGCHNQVKISMTLRAYKWFHKPPSSETTWKTKKGI